MISISDPTRPALNGPLPYHPWMLNKDRTRDWPWGVRCSGGYNCVGLPGGITFLASREEAEILIRSHGHEPGEPKYG